MSRAVAEMIPAVTVPPSPNGLPIASTQSPTLAFVESPQEAAGSGVLLSTLRSARSVTVSRPTTCACSTVSSDKVTVIWSALAITCALVTISPDGSMMKPEPSDAARGPAWPPGGPLSPKKSRNRSSSEVPGEAGGVSCAVLAGAAAVWLVEILTTTPSRCPASCEKTSANGVSGGASATGGGAGAGAGGIGAAAGAGLAGGAGAGLADGAGDCAAPGIAGAISISDNKTAVVALCGPNALIKELPSLPVPSGAGTPLPRPRSNAGLSDALDMKWRRDW